MPNNDEFKYLMFRFSSEVESTLGMIMAGSDESDKLFRCFTIEDEARQVKVPGETRIPAGTYEIKLRQAGGMHQRYLDRFPFHQGMLWLQDVPGFEWIYIHPGNNDTHTEGCILVGDGAMSNIPRVSRGSVSYSVNAYKALYLEVIHLFNQGKRVFIEIRDIA